SGRLFFSPASLANPPAPARIAFHTPTAHKKIRPASRISHVSEMTATARPGMTPYLPGSYRELLYVALPLMLSAATQSLMHIIDRIFLTWHSQEELAAAMPAGILYWTVL